MTEVRPAIKAMSSLGLVGLRNNLRNSIEASDIQFIKEVNEELKLRDRKHLKSNN